MDFILKTSQDILVGEPPPHYTLQLNLDNGDEPDWDQPASKIELHQLLRFSHTNFKRLLTLNLSLS